MRNQQAELPLQASAPLPHLTDIPIPGERPPVDEETLRRQNEAIEEARIRFEGAKARHAKGEISDRDLALANRDLVIAEARGDAVKIAAAGYEFAGWEFTQVRNGSSLDPDVPALIYRKEVELIKAQHALALAKAGTNEYQIAGAELKFAEMMLGAAHRPKKSGLISDEELKRLENEHFYADLKYKRLKQALPNKQ
jgi:hypothetical protein